MNGSQTVIGKLGNIERMLGEQKVQREELSSLVLGYVEKVKELEGSISYLGKVLIELEVRVKKLEGSFSHLN